MVLMHTQAVWRPEAMRHIKKTKVTMNNMKSQAQRMKMHTSTTTPKPPGTIKKSFQAWAPPFTSCRDDDRARFGFKPSKLKKKNLQKTFHTMGASSLNTTLRIHHGHTIGTPMKTAVCGAGMRSFVPSKIRSTGLLAIL